MLKKIAILVVITFSCYYSFSQTITPGTRSLRGTGTYYDMTGFDSSPFEDFTFDGVVDTNKTWINFRMLKPKNFSPSNAERYPLIVFFHGAGEGARAPYSGPAFALDDPRYDNNDYHLVHGGAPFINAKNSDKFPGFVIYAQNDYRSWGFSGDGQDTLSLKIAKVIELLETMIRDYNVDPFRIYVNGLSNGGLATWGAFYNRPDLFAAVAPMSAKGDTAMIPVTGSTPIWLFQGGMDGNPSQEVSDFVVEETKKRGGDIRYTVYPEVGHDVWNRAWAEPDFFSWLLSKRKNDIHVWGGDSAICVGESVRLGVAAGLDEYLWSNGATTNEIVVSQPGTFRLKIRRGTIWSDWSKPVIIKYKEVTAPAEIKPSQSLYLPSIAGSTVTLGTSIPYAKYLWSNGATTSTIKVSAIGTYSVLVTSEKKCVSNATLPVKIISGGAVVGRPILPTDLTINAVSETSLRIDWTDNNENETGVEIFRSTVYNTGYKFIGTAPANATQYLDEGLVGSTAYYYRIRAVNAVGASNTSSYGIMGRTLDDFQAPTAPKNLTLTNGVAISLAWQPSTDNVAVHKYLIYRNGKLIDSTTNTTYTTGALAASVKYTFYVKAKDISRNISSSSNQVSAITPNSGMVDFSFYIGNWNNLPAFGSLTPVLAGQINNFKLNPRTQDDYFAFKFQGYLKIKKTGAYTFFTKSDDGSKLYINGFNESNLIVNNDKLQSATESSNTTKLFLNANNYYPIYVTFFEKTGGQSLEVSYRADSIINSKASSTSILSKRFIPDSLLFRVKPITPAATPAKPTNILVSSGATSPVVITNWTSAKTSTFTEVYRSLSATGTFDLVATVDSGVSTFTDMSISQNVTYFYKFRSIGITGESSFTNNYSITVSGFPSVATELKATSVTSNKVVLSWKDNSANESGYRIERKTGNGSFALIGTVLADVVVYIDSVIVPGTTYSYRVIASNAKGFSLPSNVITTNVPLPTIAFDGDWKIAALQATDSYGFAPLTTALLNKEDYMDKTTITAGSTRTLNMQIAAMPEGGMMIFNIENGVANSVVKLFTSTNSTNGADGTWTEIVGSYLTLRDDDLQKVDFPKSTSTQWYRVQFINNSSAILNLKELGLYAFKPNVRHNYILVLGASIEELSGGYTDFKNEILAQFPGKQPVVFNLAESGTNAQGQSLRLQAILDRHPKAGYVLMHQGGNNISLDRPLTADELNSAYVINDFAKYMESNIVRCRDAGKITVHARITFRDYKTEPMVNGGRNQEFGSLPYNILLDKIIRKHTPEFYDTLERRPRMDLYEFTLNNQIALANDGIHPTRGRGYMYINRWVSSAVRYFYTGTFPDPIPYTEFVPTIRTDADKAVIKAEISRTVEDVFSARILVEQIGDRNVRIPLHVRLDNVEALKYPSIPAAPSSLSITSKLNSAKLTWVDNSNDETYFTVYRSAGNTSNYQIVDTYLPSNTTSYLDSSINAHTTYYYKVVAGNLGGKSAEILGSTTTLNSNPTLGEIDKLELVKGRNYSVTIPYSDFDGDIPTYTLLDAPTFVSISGGKLNLNPLQSDIGTYNNVVLNVNDGFGGIASTSFNIVVSNDNNVPVIVAESDKSLYEMESLNFVFRATDLDNDSLTWTRLSGPAFITTTSMGGGRMKVSVNPSLTDAGTYTLSAKVADPKGGESTTSITVSVLEMNSIIQYRVNAGGDLFASTFDWLGDKKATPVSYFDLLSNNIGTGSASSYGSSKANNTSAPREVLGSYRYDFGNKAPIHYNFPVSNSKYIVNLFFADPNTTTSSFPNYLGKRVFHIIIENDTLLKNFEPFKENGNLAIQKQFLVNVSDGILDIRFGRKNAIITKEDAPMINGLEIIQLTPSVMDRRGDIESETSSESGLALQLVPNPVDDITHLKGLSEMNTGEGQIKVSVVNELGNLVWSKVTNSTVVSSDMEISFREMQSGFYILKVEMPNGLPFERKIIKK